MCSSPQIFCIWAYVHCGCLFWPKKRHFTNSTHDVCFPFPYQNNEKTKISLSSHSFFMNIKAFEVFYRFPYSSNSYEDTRCKFKTEKLCNGIFLLCESTRRRPLNFRHHKWLWKTWVVFLLSKMFILSYFIGRGKYCLYWNIQRCQEQLKYTTSVRKIVQFCWWIDYSAN